METIVCGDGGNEIMVFFDSGVGLFGMVKTVAVLAVVMR